MKVDACGWALLLRSYNVLPQHTISSYRQPNGTIRSGKDPRGCALVGPRVSMPDTLELYTLHPRRHPSGPPSSIARAVVTSLTGLELQSRDVVEMINFDPNQSGDLSALALEHEKARGRSLRGLHPRPRDASQQAIPRGTADDSPFLAMRCYIGPGGHDQNPGPKNKILVARVELVLQARHETRCHGRMRKTAGPISYKHPPGALLVASRQERMPVAFSNTSRRVWTRLPLLPPPPVPKPPRRRRPPTGTPTRRPQREAAMQPL